MCRCKDTKKSEHIRDEEVLVWGGGHCVGCGLISLPVNDDWVRGRLISVSTTFLLTTAAEWAENTTRGKSQWSGEGGNNKLNRGSHHLSGPSTSTGPDYSAPQSAKIQEHTKEA